MPSARAWRTSAPAYGVLVTLLALVVCLAAQQPAASPVALVAEVDGIIHPVTAQFMQDVMARADTTGARVVVFILRTPGGLLDSTRDIIDRLIAARTPVVVFVSPSGAGAASAGFLIALAADVAVMAPGTHIGAAHPVAGAGQPMGETLARKVAEDTAAYARTLAEARHRNVAFAGAAVTESRAFTDREALAATPPLIDFVAADVDALLRTLDGRTITRFDGRTLVLRTQGVRTERVEMPWTQRLLSGVAHPQIAYLLFSLGVLGLTVELWHPGAILPGVVGVLALLLGFFGLQILSVGIAGILLVALGLALLVLELKVPSFGVLGVGGTVALVFGSLMVTRTVPGVEVDLGIVLAVSLGLAVVFLFLGRLALRAQHLAPVTGVDGLVGTTARALGPIAPGEIGQVTVHGEIWRASTRVPVGAGADVRVTAVSGLTLSIEPADRTPSPGGLS